MEIVIAIFAIVITILLSPPMIKLFRNFVDSMNRKSWSGKEYRKGHLQNKSHIAFDSWNAIFDVDNEGNCSQTYRVRAINIGQRLVDAYYIPVFADAAPMKFSDIEPWAKIRTRNLEVTADTWDEENAQGRIKVKLNPAIAPGERRRFSYGLKIPSLFHYGDDYYNWDVEIPYYEMQCSLNFAQVWIIKYARWKSTTDHFLDNPVVDGQKISWVVKIPKPGTRLHLELGLARKDD